MINEERIGGQFAFIPDQSIQLPDQRIKDTGMIAAISTYSGYADENGRRLGFTFANVASQSFARLLPDTQDLSVITGDGVGVDKSMLHSYPAGSRIGVIFSDGLKRFLTVETGLELPPMLGTGVVADIADFNLGGARPVLQYAIGEQATLKNFANAIGSGDVLDADQFSQYMRDKMAASQTFSNLFILGFIYLYAGLSVIFGTYQDIETRRSEIQTLNRIGFSNYSILRKYIHERLVSLTFGLLLLFLFFLLIFYPVKASVDSQVGAGFARFPFVEVGTAIVVFIAFLFVSAVSALMKELRLRN